MFYEIAHNQLPVCYVTLHHNQVEVLICCQPERRIQMMEELFYLFDRLEWNRKVPKLLKLLQREGTIPPDQRALSVRYTGTTDSEGELVLERLCRQHGRDIRILEQNRKGRVWVA